MAQSNHQKVDRAKIKREMIETILEIDSNKDLKQTDRTKLYARVAQKVKSALYEDGRKAERNRLTGKSYERYMSDMKKAGRELLGWHHTLEATVAKLVREAPELKDLAESCIDENSEARRHNHGELMKALKATPSKKRGDKFRKIYDIANGMKLDHDVVTRLVIHRSDKEILTSRDKEALEEKKSNVVVINTNKIKSIISRNLYAEAFSHRAVALALASGRRPIEILYQGEFKVAGDFVVTFTGHAKKREFIDKGAESDIYTLIPAADFVKALEAFRKMEPVKALEQYKDMPAAERNVEINRRTAKTLNMAAKRLLGDSDRMFKDTRAIWARMVYEAHFRTDPKWLKVDEDLFWKAMLGHDEAQTQMHYKHIKLDHAEIEDEPEEESRPEIDPGERLKILEVLGGMESLAKAEGLSRKAMDKINGFVLATVKEKPETTITQSLIFKGTGANRQAIKKYMRILDLNYPQIIG